MYYNGFKPNRVPYKRTVAPWARKTEVAPDAAVVAKIRGLFTGITSATYPMHKAAPAENPFNAPVRVGVAQHAARVQAKDLTFDVPKAHAFLNVSIDALCNRIAENHASYAAAGRAFGLASGAAVALKHAESVMNKANRCGCDYWACPDCRGDR
jgi:hypothetical protein